MPSPTPDPRPPRVTRSTKPSPDQLSPVPVRHELLELGGGEVAKARRYGRQLGLVMLRLREPSDGADAVATEVLHGAVRIGADHVVRLEPGRFVALLPETALSGTMHLAARLQHRLAAQGLRSRIGFAALDDADERFPAVLARAHAMVEER